MTAVFQTSLRRLPLTARGKVRDLYDLGDQLLFVACDRISAFDVVMPTPIPDKGRILTAMSLFWFERLGALVPNHVVGDDLGGLDLDADERAHLAGRALIVRKAKVVPFECVARGWLAGSGWKDYQRTGAVCGVALPTGLRQSERLPAPIFTPATKAGSGHDENVPFAAMEAALGASTARRLAETTLDLYGAAAAYAETRGIVIADTKFEFGTIDGVLTLVDEALTPDSSRFWPAEAAIPGTTPPSFDKQPLRDWLEALQGWGKVAPGPTLPPEVVAGTRARYLEAYQRLTGRPFDHRA
ncbi:MAG: phosphoribosylaminoimidazolesuccinocarboxamide synthase [Alphaproteobacteria bacterium]|nr:phosphoribosylaminoimidazolesuccinocarboxamide synthase [Alphaproteobacteria bacterium]